METAEAPVSNALFVDFVALLRDYGVPASVKDLLELNHGLEKGVVKNLDDLFVFSRLVFVRRVEHMDAFERAFCFYFYGIDIPSVAEGDMELFNTKQFREWLEKQIAEGKLPKKAIWHYDVDELMQKFWDTVREQMEEHHGGSKWVGQKGNSPFGHSGNSERGVRAGGIGAGGRHQASSSRPSCSASQARPKRSSRSMVRVDTSMLRASWEQLG
mgnify:CR=1 FL=1